jgi:hypothetical protein
MSHYGAITMPVFGAGLESGVEPTLFGDLCTLDADTDEVG